MSSYKYLKNLSSFELHDFVGTPDSLGIAAPQFPSKQDFREWCNDPLTDHYFISMVEGSNPFRRISETNPARLMHGMIVDYDSEKLIGQSTDDIKAKILTAVSKHQAMAIPNWILRTYSDKVRLVWEFENPVLVDHAAVRAEFIKELMSKLAVDRLVVGGRDKTGDKPNQFFEIGRDWKQIEVRPVSDTLLNRCFFEAAGRATTKTSERAMIPIDQIAAAVQSRFPGRWTTAFEYNARGPLFWIDDGIDRVGAQVGEYGMVCYSDRAGKSFVSWEEIFGKKFVEEYENKTIEQAIGGLHYDGKVYHEYEQDHDRVVTSSKDDLCLRLRCLGFSDALAKKQTASEIDEIRFFINTHRRVVAAVPMVHYRPGPVDYAGEKWFNNRCTKVAQPADDGDPSKWPFIYEFLTKFFDPIPQDGFYPHEYFFAWLKRFYQAGHLWSPAQGHGIIITGGAGSGKTFLSSRLLSVLMGGCEDASPLLSGQTAFTKNLASAPVWSIDDTTTSSDYNHRRLFGDLLKRSIANPFMDYHPKGADARRVPWHGRVIITCNADSSSLDVIPTLDNSISDKLMYFKTSDNKHPFKSNEENEKTLRREIPHFAKYLLDYTIPKDMLDKARFGIKPYHHEFVRKVAAESSPEFSFVETLDMFGDVVNDMHGKFDWDGTSTQLYSELQLNPSTKAACQGWNSSRVGRALSKLDGFYAPYKGQFIRRGRTVHRFDWKNHK